MIIREAVDADLPALTALHRWSVEETVATFTSRADSEEQRGAWVRARQAKGFPVLVALSDHGDLLGFASYDQFLPSDGYAHTMDHSVYIVPTAHGRGVGSALMRALIDAARADPEVWTLMGKIEGSNTVSIGLHAKLGFAEHGRLPGVGYKFGRRLDLVYMGLEV